MAAWCALRLRGWCGGAGAPSGGRRWWKRGALCPLKMPDGWVDGERAVRRRIGVATGLGPHEKQGTVLDQHQRELLRASITRVDVWGRRERAMRRRAGLCGGGVGVLWVVAVAWLCVPGCSFSGDTERGRCRLGRRHVRCLPTAAGRKRRLKGEERGVASACVLCLRASG